MAGNGTTIASLLAGSEEPAQSAMQGEDTLEGARADGDSEVPQAETLDPSIYFSRATDPAPAEADLLPLPTDSGEESADSGSADAPADAAAEEEDPGPCNAPEDSDSAGEDAVQGVAGASAPAGAAHLIMDVPGFDGVRIAIGDWRDPNWNGHGWVKILPWEGDLPGDVIEDVDGDGFDDSVPGDDGSYAGGDYSYDGYYDGYYGDGSGDIGGDGFEDGSGGGYDYAGYYDYSITSAGDVNGDGFEDWLVEGNGYSYYQYGGDYSYGGGYTSTSAGDVNGDGFEDWLIEGYGNSFIQYGGDYSYTDYSYSYTGGDGASYAGDGATEVFIENGELVFYASGLFGMDISIQTTGDAVVTLNDRGVFVSAGDGQAVISIDGDVTTFTGSLHGVAEVNVYNAQVATMGLIGELTPVYFPDA